MEFNLSKNGLLTPVIRPRGQKSKPLPSFNPPIHTLPPGPIPKKFAPPIIETPQHPATPAVSHIPEPPPAPQAQSNQDLATVSQSMRATRTRIGTLPTR